MGFGARHIAMNDHAERAALLCELGQVPGFRDLTGQVPSLRALPHTRKTRDGVLGLPRASWAWSMACQVASHSTDSAYAGSA